MRLPKLLLILSFFWSATSPVIAKTILANYSELLDALKNGEDVRVIYDFDKCSQKNAVPISKHSAGQLVGGSKFFPFNAYPILVAGKLKNVIATSNTILVEHSKFGLVRNYVRLRVFGDNSAEVHAAFYDARSYELKSSIDFLCRVDASGDGGIKLIL